MKRYQLTSLIPKAKSEMPEHKYGKNNVWTSIFFLSWDNVLNQHHTIRYHSCFYSCSLFLKKTAIIIAIHGQKTLHWQLRKVIISGMYNCNFEALLCIRFRKKLLMLSLSYELLIFAYAFFSYRSFHVQLSFKL